LVFRTEQENIQKFPKKKLAAVSKHRKRGYIHHVAPNNLLRLSFAKSLKQKELASPGFGWISGVTNRCRVRLFFSWQNSSAHVWISRDLWISRDRRRSSRHEH
jgi:hypothetical protein